MGTMFMFLQLTMIRLGVLRKLLVVGNFPLFNFYVVELAVQIKNWTWVELELKFLPIIFSKYLLQGLWVNNPDVEGLMVI